MESSGCDGIPDHVRVGDTDNCDCAWGPFGLGLFSPFAYAPRAQTGSCKRHRPHGPDNIKLISLQGQCQGELPQYAALFSGSSSYLNGNNIINFGATSSFTVTAWVYMMAKTGYDRYYAISKGQSDSGLGYPGWMSDSTPKTYFSP